MTTQLTPYEQQFCEDLKLQILPLIKKYLYENDEHDWDELKDILLNEAESLKRRATE